jgi:hypothetical protein
MKQTTTKSLSWRAVKKMVVEVTITVKVTMVVTLAFRNVERAMQPRYQLYYINTACIGSQSQEEAGQWATSDPVLPYTIIT